MNLVKAQDIISVLLVEDHPIVREGFQRWFSRSNRYRLIGEASSGEEGLKRIEELNPDLVLLDIIFSQNKVKLNGLDLAEIILRNYPETKIIIYTGFVEMDFVKRATQLGVHGFLFKESTSTKFNQVVKTVFKGGKFFDEKIIEYLNLFPEHEQYEMHLSKRQKEVIGLIAEGYSRHEISEMLKVKVGTIDEHRKRAMKKLKLSNNFELLKYVMENQQGALQVK